MNIHIRRQRGLSLFISLIVLVAMSLAAIRLMRSTDATNLMAGNLAFKQATLQAVEQGIAAASAQLTAPAVWTTLANDNPAIGYYSSLPLAESDPSVADPRPNWNDPSYWDGSRFTVVNLARDATTGVSVSYVVHRMCSLGNTPYNGGPPTNPNQCSIVTPSGGGGGGSHRVGGTPAAPAPQVGYRITLRAVGPRGVTSVAQAIVYLSA